MRIFGSDLLDFIFTMEEEVAIYKLKRINSLMLLKTILQCKNSPLYDTIFKQIDSRAFPVLINNCYYYAYNPESEAEAEDDFDEDDYYEEEVEEDVDDDADVYIDLEEPEENNADESEQYEQIAFKINTDEEICFVFDEELTEAIQAFKQMLNSQDEIYLLDLCKALIDNIPRKLSAFLKMHGINPKTLQKDLAQLGRTNISPQSVEIPEELKSFVQVLNDKYRGKKCDISGRDKECNLIWQTMQKKTKRNIVLIGEPGVGKTSIVEKITCDILSGNCPEEFKNMTVLSLDVTSSISGTRYRGDAEERYSMLAQYLEETPNIILFIDEIHLINGAGACREGEADLANAIKPILAGDSVRVIGATTSREYEKYFSQDGAIKRRFRVIDVKEPKLKEVPAMLKKTIETLSEYHNVKISKEMLQFIIVNSACFNYETKNPDRTKDLIDLSMVVAKQKGLAEVDKDSVLENFEYNIKFFKKMSKKTKLTTAFHEAGHAITFMCSNLLKKQYKVIAVSIMPTDNYGGVTVYERNEFCAAEPTTEYYVDLIASDLAGRVAEKLFTGTISSGAATDLKNATETAYNVIARFGMSNFGQNRIFIESLNSEKTIDGINAEIDELIQRGFSRAEEIISKNKKYFDKLVELLMAKGIVSQEELKEILKAK